MATAGARREWVTRTGSVVEEARRMSGSGSPVGSVTSGFQSMVSFDASISGLETEGGVGERVCVCVCVLCHCESVCVCVCNEESSCL